MAKVIPITMNHKDYVMLELEEYKKMEEELLENNIGKALNKIVSGNRESCIPAKECIKMLRELPCTK